MIGEIALAAVLLVGAGLLLRTFSQLLKVKLGFEPERVLTMQLLVLGEAAQRSNKVEAILDRVQALPEVRAVGTIQYLPLGPTSGTGFYFDGQPKPAPSEALQTEASLVSRGYFSAMGIPILRGRPFDERDRMGRPRVCLINETFVKKYFLGRDPLGGRLVVAWTDEAPTEIVGIVGDIRQNGLTTEPRPTVFMAQAQVPAYVLHLVVRTTSEPERLAAAVRHEIQAVDKNQPVTKVATMEHYLEGTLAKPRLYSILVGAFATLALLLSAVGIYGLMAYAVSQRTHEIGIRMALGAVPRDVLRMMLRQGMRLALGGVGVGLVGAVALTRVLAGLLYGVRPLDLWSFTVGGVVLGIAVLLAAYLPARRATKVDPLVALRYE